MLLRREGEITPVEIIRYLVFGSIIIMCIHWDKGHLKPLSIVFFLAGGCWDGMWFVDALVVQVDQADDPETD